MNAKFAPVLSSLLQPFYPLHAFTISCKFWGWQHRFRPEIQLHSWICTILLPNMGVQLVVFGFFPLNKISVIRQVRMSPASTAVWVKRWHVWNASWCAKIVDAFCLHLRLLTCGQQKLKYPSWSSMADLNCHYTGWYYRSGISGLNLWVGENLELTQNQWNN